MDKASKQYLVETEVIFRGANQDAAEFIAEGEGIKTATTVPFYCECSNTECRQRIRLTPQVYATSHKNKRQFIIKEGHDIPEVEKIIEQNKDYHIIEKYGDPPKYEDIESALKELKL
jgi:hypothetical protein